MSYTTTDLLASIERRSFMPAGQRTFTEAEQLAIADEVTIELAVPEIMDLHEDYLVFSHDQVMVANQNAYPISPRSAGMMCKDIAFIRNTAVDYNVPRLEPDEVKSTQTGTPRGFFLKNDSVILYPTPANADLTLRMDIFLKPSRNVVLEEGAVISAINTGTNVVTVTAIPSDWVTGDIFDFIDQDGTQSAIAIDYTSTDISSTNITFASLPDTLAVGDYIALAGETPLVQLPSEFRQIVAQAVAFEILSRQNQSGADKAKAKLDRMIITAKKMLRPRVEAESRIIKQTWF